MQYQPKTGAACGCKRGQERDNCPNCEGTGKVIDFAAIRARASAPAQPTEPKPGDWYASKSQSPRGSWRVYTKQNSFGTLDASAPGIGPEGSKRNAILQAAAPELLAAAKDILQPLGDAEIESCWQYKALREAIAKATKTD